MWLANDAVMLAVVGEHFRCTQRIVQTVALLSGHRRKAVWFRMKTWIQQTRKRAEMCLGFFHKNICPCPPKKPKLLQYGW